MGDLTLVMTTAPSRPTHNQVVAVGCIGVGIVFFAAAMWTWFVSALRRGRLDLARAQTVPADTRIKELSPNG
jgi:hypothetical protein